MAKKNKQKSNQAWKVVTRDTSQIILVKMLWIFSFVLPTGLWQLVQSIQLVMQHQWMNHEDHSDKGNSPAAHLYSHSVARTAPVRIIHRCRAPTLLPLCHAVKTACPLCQSFEVLWPQHYVAGEQCKLLHWGDGCGRKSHSSSGINFGFLSRRAAHLIKVQSQRSCHVSAWTSCRRTQPSRDEVVRRSHPQGIRSTFVPFISNREYAKPRELLRSCVKSESNFGFEHLVDVTKV